MPYSRIREAPESSSAATLRAVVAALSDGWHIPQHFSANEKRLATFANYLPESLIKRGIKQGVRRRALEKDLARFVSADGLARQAARYYQNENSSVGYPAIFIGAPNGGVAYLAALLGVPFLPAYFLLSFADHTRADDIESYQQHGARLIDTILKRNPDLMAINHYDPVHDRFLVEEVNHIRLKLLTLPEAYQEFISDHLAPGGHVLYLDNHYHWPQFQIDDRHMFQVGGLGGYSATDFLEGSKSLNRWLSHIGSSHRNGWKLSSYPIIETNESEWGSLPIFREAVKAFAQQQNFEFHSINGKHPEDFSALAYTAFLWESRLHEHTPNGILVECFSQINPTAALRANLLPLWMPFNTQDSLEYLARMSAYTPKNLDVGLSLLANFSKTPDTPPASAWVKTAEKIGPTRLLGLNPERYPMDIAALFNYLPALKQWTQEKQEKQEMSSRAHLSPDELLEMISYLGSYGSKLFAYLLENKKEEAGVEAPAPETT